MSVHTEIEAIIRECTKSLSIHGKCGEAVLKTTVAGSLSRLGFEVDAEDSRVFLPAGMPVWRDKESQEVVPTPGRRRVDLVVRKEGKVIALIETESDLNDLREHGVSRRSGHYDVYSIARSGAGTWFDSYKSLERMAAAAYYASGGKTNELENIRSDLKSDHNPQQLALFLVTGLSRALDRRILEPRRASLGARIISVIER